MKFEAGRPLVGTEAEHGVIDPDVIWSCTNCGACVEECPVDIEHIDHIDGMRRHQVLIESAFPTEASGMLKNLENKGDPWGMGASRRLAWAEELDFEVPVIDGPIGGEVEYLFWVGCAGALEDRAKKTTKAIATLLHSGRGELRGARPGRDLHRRPGAADGQRVRVLDAGRTEHRDPERGRPGRGRGEDDRRVLPALLQHDRQRVPAARRELRGGPPHPAARQAGRRRGRSPRSRRSRRRSPTTTRVSWAGTTRCSPRRGRSWSRSPASRPRKCTGARTAGSAAAPAGPGCGWKSGSASASTPSGSTRPSAPTPTPSPPAAPTAWSCWATPWRPRKPAAKPRKASKSWTWPRCWPAPSSRPRRPRDAAPPAAPAAPAPADQPTG